MRIVLILLLCSYILQAHQTGLSYLQLTQKPHGEVAVVYKKPLEDTQAKDISINFPAFCNRLETKTLLVKNGFVIRKFSLACTHSTLRGSRIWIDGLVSSDKGVVLYYKNFGVTKHALLRASRPLMLIDDTRSSLQVFMEYLSLGFFHILSGYDHLLFLFAIILLVNNLKLLFFSITAFTLSHSISLALSALHLISVPAPFVEAMIALSIVILYREVIEDDRASFSRRHLPLMVLFFGLLHGLGFASALKEIGLPPNDIPAALLAFNIGVELGQIFFVVIILIFGFMLRFRDKKAETKELLAYIFGILSSFWLIERVMNF